MFNKTKYLVMLLVGLGTFGADAATVKKQSAIQSTTTVRARVEATGVYNQECYDAYYGCMDQFCMMDNSNGGSCGCSDDSIALEKEFEEIKDKLDEADRIKTEEVERINAGANADIIFTGKRNYDDDGSVLNVGEVSKSEARKQRLDDIFKSSHDDDDDIWDSGNRIDISSLTGKSLYNSAHGLCVEQMSDSCEKDLVFLQQIYLRQISSDCKAFENAIAVQRKEAKVAMTEAEAAVRQAYKDSFAEANKYDRGECMVELKKCMQGPDACGDGWENCVGTVAYENMQNNKAVSTAGKKVATVVKYSISDSVMEMLEAKRFICERVTDQCLAVRDTVWDDFLREAAPTLNIAELRMESKLRQSCLTDISTCIRNACTADIAGKGVATMDACLARPDMARSFCKIEIDRCERMDANIWNYVKDRLASMRVDACNEEVASCLQDANRCGSDYFNCIGMDYNFVRNMCPLEKLVVCKQGKPDFSMDDIDSIISGIFLNIDNSALTNCQNLADEKMIQICGSTEDCNRFINDSIIGAGSLRSQKNGAKYTISGLFSIDALKIGDADGTVKDGGKVLKPGRIGYKDYLDELARKNKGVNNAAQVIEIIKQEVESIAGSVESIVQLLENDTELKWCVEGRNLEQITGEKGSKTTGRFPNLLNSLEVKIAHAALSQARENYKQKKDELIAKASADAELDVAQFMCQKIAENGGDAGDNVAVRTPLDDPYAIVYDVGAGLTADELTRGGSGVIKIGGVTFNNEGYLGNSSLRGGGVTRTVNAVFSRTTRICQICTQTVSQNCKTLGSSSWFHNNRKVDCTTNAPEEKCREIQM